MTQLISQNATASDNSEIPITIAKGNFIDWKKSIQSSGPGIGARRRCASSFRYKRPWIMAFCRKNVNKTPPPQAA
jgi:hypothetical protein